MRAELDDWITKPWELVKSRKVRAQLHLENIHSFDHGTDIVVVICKSSYGSTSWSDRTWRRYHSLVCSIYLRGGIWYCSSALIPHTSIPTAEMTIVDRFWSHDILPGDVAFPRSPEACTRGNWPGIGFREVCTASHISRSAICLGIGLGGTAMGWNSASGSSASSSTTRYLWGVCNPQGYDDFAEYLVLVCFFHLSVLSDTLQGDMPRRGHLP